MKRDIEGTVASLQNDNASLAEVQFATLSDLSREEQETVTAAWAKIPLDKRQRLLSVLDELAQDDFHMDFSALFRIALSDREAEVRRLAVEGLWMDEKPTIIRPLLALLEGDESPEVRASAAFGLGRFVLQGEYEEIPEERAAEIVDALIRSVTNTNEDVLVRARGLESLGFSHDERVPPIIEKVYEARDSQSRRSAICAMGRHANSNWAPIIRREMTNEDPAFRFEAVRAAGEMGDKGSTGRIIALVNDTDREVREMAVWALGEVGGQVARRTLEKLVKDTDPGIRKIAKDALVELRMLEEDDEGTGLMLFDFGADGNLNSSLQDELADEDDEDLFDDDIDESLWDDDDDFEDEDDDIDKDEDDIEWDDDEIDLEDDNDFGDDAFDDPLAIEEDDEFDDDDFNALLDDEEEDDEDDLDFDEDDIEWDDDK